VRGGAIPVPCGSADHPVRRTRNGWPEQVSMETLKLPEHIEKLIVAMNGAARSAWHDALDVSVIGLLALMTALSTSDMALLQNRVLTMSRLGGVAVRRCSVAAVQR